MNHRLNAVISAVLLAACLDGTAIADQKKPASDGFCFEQAGKMFNISPQLLWGIAKHESGLNPNAINWNTNGTYDYGVMQINSTWSKTLGKERWAALSDPCENIKTGAWILSRCINDYGYGWKAVGCYNSRTPAKSRKYAQRVAKTLLEHNLISFNER